MTGAALRDAAIAVVVDGQGRVLTVSRPPPQSEQSLPGGEVDPGETPEQAVVRELVEEAGVEIGDLAKLGELLSPTDGRTVHVYRAGSFRGDGESREPPATVAWLAPAQLLAQASDYRSHLETLDAQGVFQTTARRLMDLGVGDVHAPGGTASDQQAIAEFVETVRRVTGADMTISTETRDSIPTGDFALPAKRKYPLDTAARTRNAAARLEQMKGRGKLTESEYAEARKRIGVAAKRFGIDSEFNVGGKAARVRPKPRGQSIHVRADLAPGGALHVRHMTQLDDTHQVVTMRDGSLSLRDLRPIEQSDDVDPGELGIRLMGPATWKDGTPKKLIWVQLAEVGAWRGHPAGEFSMTPTTFSQIVRNFETRGLPIPYDFEHASEQPATSGSIPLVGAKAPGWVHRLDNRGNGGLWGLTEWFDPARDGIKAGEYGFLSPAIQLRSKDPVTGAQTGAKLTSVAITNQPFLTHLEGLIAASDKAGAGGATVQLAAGPKGFDRPVHATSEYMPRVKSALKMSPLCSATECSDELDRLRELCMSLGPEGQHEGANLSDYTTPLMQLVGAQPGATWSDVFDIVEDLIDAAVEENEARFQADDAGAPRVDMNDKAPAAAAANEEPMTDENKSAELTIQLRDTSTKLTDATLKLATTEGQVVTLTGKLTDVEGQFLASEKVVKAVLGLVTLRDGETLDVAVKRIVEENVTLLKDKNARDEADLKADVEGAFDTYKEAKGLTEANIPAMTRLCKADRAAFNDLYPPIQASQRHLLRTQTPPLVRPPAPGAEETESFNGLVKRLMTEKKLGYSAAQDEAQRLIHERSTRF